MLVACGAPPERRSRLTTRLLVGLVECFINKIEPYRRVFSHFEKLSKNYIEFLSFVSTLVC